MGLAAGIVVFMNQKRVAKSVITGIVAAITAGCGINTASTVANDNTTTPLVAASTTSTTSSSPSSSKIGGTFTVTGNDTTDYLVTLTKIEQNARGIDEFNQPSAGYHLVAIIFTVKGDKHTAQDDANSDAIVVGSNKQLYDSDTDNIAGYTNFSGGSFTVSPGEEVVGAVVFKLPIGVTATKVMWAAALSNSTAAWDVG